MRGIKNGRIGAEGVTQTIIYQHEYPGRPQQADGERVTRIVPVVIAGHDIIASHQVSWNRQCGRGGATWIVHVPVGPVHKGGGIVAKGRHGKVASHDSSKEGLAGDTDWKGLSGPFRGDGIGGLIITSGFHHI